MTLELVYANGQLAALERYKLGWPTATNPVVAGSAVLQSKDGPDNLSQEAQARLQPPTTPHQLSQIFDAHEQGETRSEPKRKLSSEMCTSCRKNKHYGSCEHPRAIPTKVADFNIGMHGSDPSQGDNPSTSPHYHSAVSSISSLGRSSDGRPADEQAASGFADLFRHQGIRNSADEPGRMTGGLNKVAASALRSRIQMQSTPGGKSIAMLGNTPVGALNIGNADGGRVGTGDSAHVHGAAIDPRFQGLGIGKKLYGETMRRQPDTTLRSDTQGTSSSAQRVWEGMKQRPGYNVNITPGYENRGTSAAPRYRQAPDVIPESPHIFTGSLPTASALPQAPRASAETREHVNSLFETAHMGDGSRPAVNSLDARISARRPGEFARARKLADFMLPGSEGHSMHEQRGPSVNPYEERRTVKSPPVGWGDEGEQRIDRMFRQFDNQIDTTNIGGGSGSPEPGPAALG